MKHFLNQTFWLKQLPSRNKPPCWTLSEPEFSDAFLCGKLVFTTFRWPEEFRWIDQHILRLQQNAHAMNIPFTWSTLTLLEALGDCVPALSNPDAQECVIRISVIPEERCCTNHLSDPFQDLPPSPNDTLDALPASRLYVSFRDCPTPITSSQRITLKTIGYQKAFPLVKSAGSLIEAFALRRRVQIEGYNDALWVNAAGHITESTTANFFGIRDNALTTPTPETDGCLPGIARLKILEKAAQKEIPVHHEPLTPAELNTLDGAFLTNSVTIQPIQTIDDCPLSWSDEATALFNQLI